jgi:hypothetical protein
MYTVKDGENEKRNNNTAGGTSADRFNSLSESFNTWIDPKREANMGDNKE